MDEKTLSEKVREFKKPKTLQDELSAEIAAIKAELPDVYSKYTKTKACRRFTVA